LLFGIAPTDPSLYVAVALTVVATALLATWLPMRRASGINPVDILRSD
jgi:ABC-type lipoprotein release transport system permease subunit